MLLLLRLLLRALVWRKKAPVLYRPLGALEVPMVRSFGSFVYAYGRLVISQAEKRMKVISG